MHFSIYIPLTLVYNSYIEMKHGTEMQTLSIFDSIVSIVRKDENYVPRTYQTIGGMWTVDTWKYENVNVQVQDEGYTTVIMTDIVKVRNTYPNLISFDKGSFDDLIDVLNSLTLKWQ